MRRLAMARSDPLEVEGSSASDITPLHGRTVTDSAVCADSVVGSQTQQFEDMLKRINQVLESADVKTVP